VNHEFSIVRSNFELLKGMRQKADKYRNNVAFSLVK